MKRFLAVAMLLLLAAFPARAQWTADGVGVCTAAGDQGPAVITSDGAGGWFMAWGDLRGADGDVYAQRVDAEGAALWTANGVAVCSSAGNQWDVQIVSDDAGGAIVVWTDRRSGVYDIYAQRIKPDGTPWWTANGVAICTASNNQMYPRMVSDGSGGAIITWADFRNGIPNTDVYIQRINAAGVVQWAADGVGIGILPTTQFPASIATDGNGGAIITWHTETAPSFHDVYAQRVNAAGVALWPANGVPVCTDPNDQSYPVIVADGAGGAIIVWYDSRGDWDLYAQRINSSGVSQWNVNGVAVCTAAGAQGVEGLPSLIPDGLGGAIITWDDWRGSAYDVYAQRISSVGVAQWTVDGIAVSTAANDQAAPVIVPDGSGGAVISWFDNRSGNHDIYTQRMSSSGAAQWPTDGVPVCTASGTQAYPVIAADGSGGAVIAWEDERGTSRDIYAHRVINTGEPWPFVVTNTTDEDTPGTLRGAILRANALPGQQTIRFNLPGVFVQTFLPLVALPPITDALVIDGFTQPGSSPNTTLVGQYPNAIYRVVIDFLDYTHGSALVFQAPGEVRGLVINGGDATIDVQSPNVTIKGCYVGTDYLGTGGGSNQQQYGIRVTADNCTIGGPAAADRVIVAGSSIEGIRVDGASDAKVQGTYVGIGANLFFGSMPVGIHLLNGASNARIGSSAVTMTPNSQEGNLIHNNVRGVVVEGAASVSNAIVGNSLYAGTPIDLGFDGPSPNDFQDRDQGPNRMMNWPVLSSAVGASVAGNMDGPLNATMYLHFYRSWNSGLNAVDFIGATTVVSGLFGAAAFDYALPPIPPGVTINAIATDLFGNTSEVSQPMLYSNTGSGPNSTANLVDGDGVFYGTATFANATATGNTIIHHPFLPPVPVSGYGIGNPNDPAIYFNITTNVSYTGGIDICLNYDENDIPGPEDNLVLLHYDGSMWVDVTTSRDPVNNTICGHVTSLSPFVIGAVTATAIGDTPVPTSFVLHDNVPNPFNPITTIRCEVPSSVDVSISIYDVAGRRVRTLVNEHRPAGVFSVQWNGDDDRGQRVASGVYFYRMRAGGFVDTKKMVLLK